MIVNITLKEAITPYVKDKVERLTAEYHAKAREAIDVLFEDLVDDLTEQLVKAGLKKMKVKK